ncbi:MAG: metal-dependent hydrolase [Chloroflexi bacterium]|nr:metal-dependent hydrolase [Chloroflexota bacterium]
MTTTYTFLGHGVHLIQTGGHTVLVDPFLEGNPHAAVKAGEVACDFILVSHGHADHIGDSIAIAQRTGAQIICNAEIFEWLYRQGVEHVHEQHIGGAHQHAFGNLKFTNAQHGSSLPDGSYGGNPVGFLLTTNDGKRIYLACDTGLFSDMAFYGEDGLDLAVLPIGDNYTMGPADALRAVKLLNPKHVVPCHYNTFPVIKQDAEAWAKRVAAETMAAPHVLKPGESLEM